MSQKDSCIFEPFKVIQEELILEMLLSCIARQCTAGRSAVFFTVVDRMDDKRGLRETFCDLSKEETRLTKYLETSSKYSLFGAVYYPLKMEDCDFTKQGQMKLYSDTVCRVH